MIAEGFNVTFENSTIATDIAQTNPQPVALYANNRRLILSGTLMTIGIFGNALALILLARRRGCFQNSKYTLMLRYLSFNNLISLLGMIVMLLLHQFSPKDIFSDHKRWDCATWLVWRFFGLSSGCIAAVMAMERCMALATPIMGHKHITYDIVRKSMNYLVLISAVITFLPLFGFGGYIDESNPELPKCIRYRDADGFGNKMYAVLFMLFGTLLCVVIVGCNLFVARVLCFIGRSRTTNNHMRYDLVHREKGNTVDDDINSGSTLYHHHSNSVTMNAASSPDEVKFAKLMAFLSISFVICWMPQMIAIPLAIIPNRVPKSHPFFMLADALMALHFTSDPYIYVLSRSKQWGLLNCIKRRRYSGKLKTSQSDQAYFSTTTEEQQHTAVND